MKITLPLPPNMANSRTHWRVKNKQRKAYFNACEILAETSAKLTAKEWHDEPPARAKAKATIYCGGRMDQDNAIARLKWPVDWMVRAGYLIGDNSDQLEWDWPITQVVKRDGNYRVEFELESA